MLSKAASFLAEQRNSSASGSPLNTCTLLGGASLPRHIRTSLCTPHILKRAKQLRHARPTITSASLDLRQGVWARPDVNCVRVRTQDDVQPIG